VGCLFTRKLITEAAHDFNRGIVQYNNVTVLTVYLFVFYISNNKRPGIDCIELIKITQLKTFETVDKY
jgi:hypothetical protein